MKRMYARLFDNSQQAQGQPKGAQNRNEIIQRLRQQVLKLDKRQAELDRRIQNAAARAKANRRDRKRAFNAIKEKKQLENEVKSIKVMKLSLMRQIRSARID